MDNEEVRKFIEFLVLGMNVPRDEIFSIAIQNTLPKGKAFEEKIKSELLLAKKVICFVTQNYLKSRFCMAELGAAWIQDKAMPLLMPRIIFEDMKDTPLSAAQMCRFTKEDLTAMYDDLRNSGIVSYGDTNEFNRHLDSYISSPDEVKLIERGDDGYYTVTIEEVRKMYRGDFRCYKISGLLDLNIELLKGETHWIFYKTGIYEDLKVGDVVKIKVTYTEIKSFPDLENPRNIYPDDLVVI